MQWPVQRLWWLDLNNACESTGTCSSLFVWKQKIFCLLDGEYINIWMCPAYKNQWWLLRGKQRSLMFHLDLCDHQSLSDIHCAPVFPQAGCSRSWDVGSFPSWLWGRRRAEKERSIFISSARACSEGSSSSFHQLGFYYIFNSSPSSESSLEPWPQSAGVINPGSKLSTSFCGSISKRGQMFSVCQVLLSWCLVIFDSSFYVKQGSHILLPTCTI